MNDTPSNQPPSDDFRQRVAVAGRAKQDQDIAEASDWLRESLDSYHGRERVAYLFDAINNTNLDVIRGVDPVERLNDDELKVVCALAMIGFMEANLHGLDASS